ncbi:unnamed protein product [Vitrella brassicaformis CCMP3155]|uniref:Rieske domain-containing protein n=1 Tax=Vitrella brassicaformis (strain CCMP3155) TaxID=1169540 RepID=A0A0G4F9N8_VITBC|nr:unnamed protein product [Vitrella brassicaformis CCMP3155]|eukprot:CEM09094.1 unnamed protein product [Vitrella brassicaformis CCMP3155]
MSPASIHQNGPQTSQANPAEIFHGISHVSTDVNNAWYPLCTHKEVPKKGACKRPLATRILGQPVALFRDESNTVRCFADRCPHKNAKLSVGRVVNGKLECFYHGWQFDSHSGAVDHIPFLLHDKSIPAQAVTKAYPCVEKYNLVWVWPGDVEKADGGLIPFFEDFTDRKMMWSGWSLETPIDHSLWVENVLDHAHVNFVHDGQFTSRGLACPLKQVVTPTKTGIKGVQVRESEKFAHEATSLELEWVAPCLGIVRLVFGSQIANLYIFGVPMAPGMSRLLLSSYASSALMGVTMDHLPLPRGLKYLLQMNVPSRDAIAMTSQMRNMREGCSPLELPIACDEMAVIYRRWHARAFTDDVWWKGWNGTLDVEDLAKSAGQSCFGAAACGEFERDVARSSLWAPMCGKALAQRFANQRHESDPFAQPLWKNALMLAAAGAAGAFSAFYIDRILKSTRLFTRLFEQTGHVRCEM